MNMNKPPLTGTKVLEVVQRDPETWESFIDDNQIGQYPTVGGAKAACKRMLPSFSPRLEWRKTDEGRYRAICRV